MIQNVPHRMKHPLEFLKSALVTGLLIVLPAWLAVLLLLNLLVKLGVLVKPLAAQMPLGINHPHHPAGDRSGRLRPRRLE